ncbi:MAG: metal-dependent transcriptional regulator [Desulfobacterales bacterium]|nr:MAG: metal-dependent transcriptional regulator [Desulfobacterales bacterium]
MAAKERLSSSMEDYLEAILHISAEKQAARAKDIAKRLKVNNSSVTSALRLLSEKGLVNYAPYDIITLTAQGKKRAEEIARRHETLKDFFVKILLIDETEAEKASCKMEHVISNKILDRLISFVEFVEICPRGGKEWLRGFRRHCEGDDISASCEDSISLCLEDLRKKAQAFKNSQQEAVLLKEMDAGQRGKILQIKGHGEINKRLSAMGVSSGSIVEVEGRALQEERIEIKVRGYHLSLRNEDAAKISVEPYN